MAGRYGGIDQLVKIGVWPGPVSDNRSRKKNEVNPRNNTIDGVPLRKLYIKNVPTYAKHEQLYSLFSYFGPVENIDICGHRNQRHPPFRKNSFAFVTFKFSKDAMTALQAKCVSLGKMKLYITAAYAYCQPCTNDDSSEDEETLDFDTSVNGESVSVGYKPDSDVLIENLDDYCLRHVFSFLPHIERVKIERVCRRWKSIARGMWRKEEQLDLANGIPFELPKKYHNLLVLKQIFKRCGASLKKLNLEGVEIFGVDGLIEAIMGKCLNLEELRLEKQFLNAYKVNMLKPLKNLKVLALSECNPIKDTNLQSLLEDKSLLTHLEITRSENVTGSFLNSIQSPLETLNLNSCEELNSEYLLDNMDKFSSTLKHLYLSNCTSLDVDDINNILMKVPELRTLELNHYHKSLISMQMHGITNLKHLESLTVSFNRNVSGEFLKLLVQTSDQLTFLDISGSDNYNFSEETDSFCISRLNTLTHLRSLNLSYIISLNSEVLRKYASRSPPIESLYFVGCTNLADNDIKSLFTSCHQLKHLDLSGCKNITAEAIKAANEAVSLRTNNQPLHLVVGGTKIKNPSQNSNDSDSSLFSDEDSEAQNENSGAQNENSGAQNENSGAQNENNGAQNENSEAQNEPSNHPLLSVSYENNCHWEPGWFFASNENGIIHHIALGNFDDWFHQIMENEIYFDSDGVSDTIDTSDFEDDDTDDFDEEDCIDGFIF